MAEIAAKSDGAITFAAVCMTLIRPAPRSSPRSMARTPRATSRTSRKRVDAATVAVPTIFHRKVAEPLMQNGIHVLVEKPISESYAEAQALIELAKAKSVILAGRAHRALQSGAAPA
jgi:hypothetical protein